MQFPSDADDLVALEAKLVGGPVEETNENAHLACPMTCVSKGDSPFLIVHGDSDPLVPLPQGETLLAALQKAGVNAELYVVKDGGHGGFNDPEVDVRARAFLDRTLKAGK